MTCFGVWGLARSSAMGNDEVASRWAALLSLRQLAHLLRHVDAVHALYYLLLHGWLTAAARRPELIVAPGMAVCLCFLLAQLAAQRSARTPASREYNFGGPSFYVAAHAHSGDGVLFLDSFYRKAELGYPHELRKTSDFALAVPPAAAGSFRGINKPFAAVEPLMLSHQRIWVVGYRPSPRLPAGMLQEEGLVLQDDFTQVVVRSYKGIWLTLWIRQE